MNNLALSPLQKIKDFMSMPETKNRISELLNERAGTFIVSLTSTVNTNEALQACSPVSLVNAALTATSLQLPINQNLGYAYIIPYKGQAQFQMGYKGFIQLAQRSGQFKTINVTEVKEGEIVGKDRLTGEIEFNWIESDEERAKLKTIGFIAYFKLLNGFEKSLYMSVDEATKHGMKFSQTMKKGYGLWVDDFDMMAKKTVVKLLLSKYAPLSVEMERAVIADQAIIEGEDTYIYPDNTPLDPQDVAADKENARILEHIQTSKTIKELEMVKEYLTDETSKAYEAKRKEIAK